MVRNRPMRAVVVALALTLLAGACTIGGDDEDGADGGAPGVTDDADGPLRLRLGTGEVRAAGEELAVVAGDELDQDAIDAITERLPELPDDADDDVDFRRPPESLPPPRAERTVDEPFGPAGDDPRPDVELGSLEVLRHQPDGPVDVAPFISITFNRPMVPIGTLDALDAEDVPVVVDPPVEGRWRWLGTRTLRLEHTDDDIDRLPAATEFTVTVPAGTEAASGGRLAESHTFTFATPAPTLEALVPAGDVIDVQPVFVLTFDQRVDPQAVLEELVVTAAGDAVDLRLATEDEVAADDDARAAQEQALPGRSVAVRPASPMPGDAPVVVEVGPGTPSAEGPRTTSEPQRRNTRTRDPLRVTGTECGVGGCRPGQPVTVVFNNPLDTTAFDADQVTIEPDVASSVTAFGDRISIAAATEADTSYTITLAGGLRDRFGQTLGDDETVTVEVGEAGPSIVQFPSAVITTDPFLDEPVVPVVSSGHETLEVTIHRVGPDDIGAYVDFVRNRGTDLRDLPDWPVLAQRTVGVGEPGRLTESTIDLAGLLDGTGQVVVVVESTLQLEPTSEDFWNTRPAVAWVQTTSLGLDAVADHERLVAWVTDLETGTPIDGVDVRLGTTDQQGTTDADGLVSLGLGRAEYLVARRGDDVAVLVPDHGRWEPYDIGSAIRWHTFDGRGLFRPGDQLRVKGWVRRLDLADGGRLMPVGADRTVGYVVRDAFGNEVATGTSELTAQGGFEVTADLPSGAALGEAFVELQLRGPGVAGWGQHLFQIQEYRRPEFEVVTESASAEPHRITAPVLMSALARYFSGGVLPDAPVTWQVSTRPTQYTPPNWPAFRFGVSPPSWLPFPYEGVGGSGGFGLGDSDGSDPCCGPVEEEETFTYEARTDTGGRHVLEVDFAGQKPDEPIFVSANASVEDVNRQAFGSTSELLVHPAAFYVGLRSERNFVRQGEPLEVEAVVTDIDGAAVGGREVTVTVSRIVEEQRGGEVVETEVDAEDCVVASADEPVGCSFEPATAGRYRIAAVVRDDDGGSHRTEITQWVAGVGSVASRTVDQEVATIVPASTELTAGDDVELLVVAPFADGRGLLTVSHAGLEQTRAFALEDGAAVVDLDITDVMVPGIEVGVELSGRAPRVGDDGRVDDDLPPRPAFASGTIHLDVRADSRTLTVVATPADDVLEPGESTTVDLRVEGPGGGAVAGAEVAVAVVDEALLSLVGYEVGDPIESLYVQEQGFLPVSRSRRGILLAPPPALGGDEAAAPTTTGPEFQNTGYATAGGGGADGAATLDGDLAAAPTSRTGAGAAPRAPQIDSRTDFSSVATFAPTVVTDADGDARVDVDLPDNLTRYRVMAVAVHDDRFGTGESTITARLPLQIRPSPPRFTNFGDRFDFPVVVHNTGDDPVTADVVLETTNLTIDGRAGRRVEVPAGQRIEVRFPVTTDGAGTARYRATVVSGDHADSATGELPAYTPATTEAFATYGVIDSADGSAASVLQPLRTPEGVVAGFGGLDIDTSSTSLQALTDAVVYLDEYDYRSADAYASRIIALVALRDVFATFDRPGQPSAADLDARIRDDVEALVALQNDDGGFATWQRGRPSDPYTSVQAGHALVVAAAADYPVPAEAKDRALGFARTIDDHFPRDWPEEARLAVRAYAVHVRHVAGDRDPARAATLYRENPGAPLDVVAWLWPVVDDAAIRTEIARTLANRVTETPAGATFATGYEESAEALVLASDRRTDGIVLDALITQQPDSDLVPKVVAGLVGNQRRGGHWSNVQENGFILLAMKRYFDTYEATTPDFVARVWLGDGYAAAHEHRGRSIDVARTTVPLGELDDDPDIVVQRSGEGRLHYRLGLRYAPADLRVEPRDEGFVVVRTYEAVDDPDDVVRNDDGSWTIEPGAMVRVRLSMVADSHRTNMALVDHLPAGLEALNPALAASPRPPAEEEEPEDDVPAPEWFGFTWFDHQSFRDDRTEAFSSWLAAGTYEYTYVARATTPGTFVTPPAKAEEIYAPEVFGRSGTDRVTVG